MVCYDSAAVPVTVQSPGAHCRVFPVVFVAALPQFTVYPPGLSSLLHRLDFIAPSWRRAPPPFRRAAVSLLLAGGMVCSDISACPDVSGCSACPGVSGCSWPGLTLCLVPGGWTLCILACHHCGSLLWSPVWWLVPRDS